MSSGKTFPYFVELPLQPPNGDVWERISEESLLDDISQANTAYIHHKQPKPKDYYPIRVQCHAKDISIQHMAKGYIQNTIKNNPSWEQQADSSSSLVDSSLYQYNPFYLPGTLLVWLLLLLVQLRPRPRKKKNTNPPAEEIWNLVRAMQLLWFHSSWWQWSITATWVYIIGCFLEPTVGTIPYLAITMVFLQAVAFSNQNNNNTSSNSFLSVCFGQAMVLSQFESNIKVGSLEISSIALFENAFRVNVFCLVLFLIPFIQSNGSTKINSIYPWRTAVLCSFLGWCLSKPSMLELLAAPQWTIPTLFMAHLWFELSQIPDDVDWDSNSITNDTNTKKKKTDSTPSKQRRRRRLQEADNNSLQKEMKAIQLDLSSTTLQVPHRLKRHNITITERISNCYHEIRTYLYFSLWMVLTMACVATLDWTLAVGNLITLWLCVGTHQFPHHPIWSLYHLTASSAVIMINTMTFVGWILCSVPIAATQAASSSSLKNLLPPEYAFATLMLQTLCHTAALLSTARAKSWYTSRNTPGYSFWKHAKTVGECLLPPPVPQF